MTGGGAVILAKALDPGKLIPSPEFNPNLKQLSFRIRSQFKLSFDTMGPIPSPHTGLGCRCSDCRCSRFHCPERR